MAIEPTSLHPTLAGVPGGTAAHVEAKPNAVSGATAPSAAAKDVFGTAGTPSAPTDLATQMAAPVVPVSNGVGTYLYTDQSNFFNELTTDPTVTLAGLLQTGPAALEMLRKDDTLLFDGRLGELQGARLVNRLQRTDGEFGYANGIQRFRRGVAGASLLEGVATGQLAAELTRASTAGAPSLMERLNALCGLQLSAKQVAALQAPLAEAAAALADPASNVVEVAATLQQKLDAVYMPGSGEVDVPRLLMERVLAERGLPPPILADLNADDLLDTAKYSAEILQGVQRTIRFASGYSYAPGAAFTSRYSYPEYAQALGIQANFTAKGPSRIQIQGLPYALGSDGFVYNMNGRPHVVDSSGELQALPQLNHYFALRRMAQQPDPTAAITQYTQATRDFFDAVAADPARQATLKIPEDKASILADDAYRPRFEPKGNEAYVQLFDPSAIPPATLFSSWQARGSPAATTLASYQLIDLELWNVQRALSDAGDTTGARSMEAHRQSLHQLARDFLKTQGSSQYQTQANPLGLPFVADQSMYEHSPLRYETFQDYRRHENDNQMHVWRGDSAVSRFSGIFPDHSIEEQDAQSLEAKRARYNGTQNIIGALQKDEGSSNGTGFICTSTDANVAASFGSGITRVGASELPKKIRDAVAALPPGSQVSIASLQDQLGLVDPRYRLTTTQVDLRGMSLEDVKKALANVSYDTLMYQEIIKRAEALLAQQPATPTSKFTDSAESKPLVLDLSALPSSYYPAANGPIPQPTAEAQAHQIREAINVVRDYVVIEKDTSGNVTVGYPKRALLLRVDKSDGIPGCQSLQGGFVSEKEWTMTHATRRSQVVGAIRPSELQAASPLAPQPPAAAAQAPVAGATAGAVGATVPTV